ncbi:MAG: AEC family transporter [Verrucomicrobiota bacterium]
MTPFQIVLPVFLVLAAGYTLRRLGVFTEEGDRSLLGVLVKLFIPCLALDVIVGNEALVRPSNWLVPPLTGFTIATIGYGVCLVFGKIFLREAGAARTFASVAGLQNYSYIPLTLCQALFDHEVVGVLFAFSLGVEVAMWTLGVGLLPGQQTENKWRRIFLNPPTLAVAVALVLNAAGAGIWFPKALDSALHMLGLCAVPTGLLVSGAMLADHMKPGILRSGWGITAMGIFLRLGLLPAIILSAAVWLPFDSALKKVLVIQSAMPAAVFPIILAKLHGGEMPVALRVVLGTLIASLATIPLWLGWVMRFVE